MIWRTWPNQHLQQGRQVQGVSNSGKHRPTNTISLVTGKKDTRGNMGEDRPAAGWMIPILCQVAGRSRKQSGRKNHNITIITLFNETMVGVYKRMLQS